MQPEAWSCLSLVFNSTIPKLGTHDSIPHVKPENNSLPVRFVCDFKADPHIRHPDWTILTHPRLKALFLESLHRMLRGFFKSAGQQCSISSVLQQRGHGWSGGDAAVDHL